MKFSWTRYMCDENEAWTVMREATEENSPEDHFCSLGHEAVQASVFRGVGFVSMGIVPAANVQKSPSARVQDERKFYVELRSDSLHWVSVEKFSWEQALHKIGTYRCLDEQKAVEMWGRSNLGNQLGERVVTREH